MHEMTFAIAHRNDDDTWSYWTYWYEGYNEETDEPEYFLSAGMGEVADEPVDEQDLPSPDEETQSWRDYAEYVAETGDDPLSNYMVDRELKQQEAWEAQYERVSFLIDGQLGDKAVLTGAMKLDNARWLKPQDLPKDIAMYFDPAGLPFSEFAQRANECDGAGAAVVRHNPDVLRVVALKVERRLAVPADEVARQLRQAAREHLAKA